MEFRFDQKKGTKIMAYQECLEAAGVKVHAYSLFGDYQGSWYADCSVGGIRGIIHGYYGSCTGCDVYQAEFNEYDSDSENALAISEKEREFGKAYLPDFQSFSEALEEVTGDSFMDNSAEIETWLRARLNVSIA